MALNTYKNTLLDKLEAAGSAGLNKSKLTGTFKFGAKALKELEAEGLIANLGSKRLTLYVLKRYDTPLERACESVEKYFAARKTAAFSRSHLLEKCTRGLPARVKKELGRALDWLVAENKLLKFKYGRADLFLPLSALPAALRSPEVPLRELTREAVLEAYQKVRERVGFTNVEIYQLQQALDVDMNLLRDFLRRESHLGRAVLSQGDWSLASEEVRRGAIELQGRLYLLVRLQAAKESSS